MRELTVKAAVSPKGNIQFTVPFPSLKYINSFMGSKAAVDLLTLGVFPNAKEITESFAVFRAAHNKLNISRKRDDVVALVVGDGCTPRTGCIVAFYSKWSAVSIDPSMRWEDNKNVQRLKVVKEKSQHYDYASDVEGKHAVILACHSHAPLKDTTIQVARGNPKTLSVVSMSCCVGDGMDLKPSVEYEDWGVHSAHFTVRVYKRPLR